MNEEKKTQAEYDGKKAKPRIKWNKAYAVTNIFLTSINMFLKIGFILRGHRFKVLECHRRSRTGLVNNQH